MGYDEHDDEVCSAFLAVYAFAGDVSRAKT